MIKTVNIVESEIGKNNFTIRKDNILGALRWFIKYNNAYKDIKICFSNLDSMEKETVIGLPID